MNAIIVSAVWGVIMMFCSFLIKNKGSYRHIAAFGLLTLLVANILNSKGILIADIDDHNMFHFTEFGLFFNTIAIFSTLVYVLLTGKEIEKYGNYAAEYFTLVFFVLCGVAILSAYNNMLMLFLGIEILSIPLYILTGSDKKNLKSNEAALKYFLMGAFFTGIMLMGIALVYGGTGSFELEIVRPAAKANGSSLLSFLEVTGLIFLFVSMAFKVSAAPFHFWTPDVYDGAPTVFTSFMATVVKAAGFIAFIRLCEVKMAETGPDADKLFGVNWQLLFALLIVATLLVGNITAVFQQSVKRMLAYSSIAQAGFMLFALFSLNSMSKEGILLYALAYSLATIGIFAVLVKMKDFTFDGFNGLAKKQPVLAATCTIFLLSLAGIPLTAGFFAKYYMLASAIKTGGYLWLVILAVLFAAVSVYYYFRVIQAMYFKEGEALTEDVTPSFKTGLILLSGIIILVGVMPTVVINYLYF
ncbi:MAG TPA: NADH-quinone oxidoreductase subunit N [Chitinophagaceae bacterium]|jgi:NADH-quinone oxidoreductase subunit N|nr:NADH-quinone oxidoreductase subunit N [Chitinophagaceae bacterium]